jgi:predicted MFS family arabinose efflux permease
VRTRAAITVVFFIDGALFATWVSRVPALATRTHADSAELGLALLGPAVGALVAMPTIGRFLPGRSSRRFCRVSMAALAGSLALPALATSVPVLAGTLLLVGLANATLDVSMNANGVSVERHIGRPILSSLHAAWSFGGFTGAGLGALAAATRLGLAADLGGAAVTFGTIGLAATSWLLPADHDADAEAPRLRVLRLPNRLALIGAACFFSFLAEGGAADWSAKLVRDDLAGTAALGAAAYAAFSLAMGTGRLMSDAVWTRLGPVKLLRRFSLLASAGFAASLAIGTAPVAIVGFAALGLGLSGVVPTLFRSAAGQPGVATGPALAAVSTLGYTGFLAGPPLVGGLAQLTSLRVACGLFVLAGLLVLALSSAAKSPARKTCDLSAALS